MKDGWSLSKRSLSLLSGHYVPRSLPLPVVVLCDLLLDLYHSLLNAGVDVRLNLAYFKGFPRGEMVKNSPANAGDIGDEGSVCESGRSPRVERGNPLQYSCLENSMLYLRCGFISGPGLS